MLSLSASSQTPTVAPAIAPSSQGSAPAAAAAPAPAAPTALPTPAITGPLSGLPPAMFDAGPFGKIAVNGILDGAGVVTGNYVPGDGTSQAALANGQIFVQKTDGVFQFYLQAGAYDISSLGTPFLATDKTISNLYGPVPIAFVKLQPGKNTSVEIGALPTMIGAEYTFSFENMNIERGLLWNQETAVSRGIQVNQTMGKVTASLSWNDGFYSNRYSWLSGTLAYASGPSTLAFVAGGNAGSTNYQTFANPIQNDGSIYNVIYTYSKGSWILQPYWQYTNVPTNLKAGVINGASTDGAAILVSRAFSHGFSMPFRFEYIGSSGSAAAKSVNLLYGPGSSATSLTLTPTYQNGGFFFRGDVSYVHLSNMAHNGGFGTLGASSSQPRAMVEFGFMFGNNIVETAKK
jgi:hypothetical protein